MRRESNKKQKIIQQQLAFNRSQQHVIAQALSDTVKTKIQSHIQHLCTNYKKAESLDPFGRRLLDEQQWLGILNYFYEEILALPPYPYLYFEDLRKETIFKYIQNVVDKYNTTLSEVGIDSMTGVEFEDFCVQKINDNGWKAVKTKASGDQGVDIIASKGTIRVVIQCKRSSVPIGNGAVQEIIAGKAYEKANYACVISNAAYTISAQRLAISANVQLLGVPDLDDFDNLMMSII